MDWLLKPKKAHNFIDDCLITESNEFWELWDGCKVYNRDRLTHAAMGLQTESAEFTDAIKKSMFYGKELDVVNLKEEFGDFLYYIAITMDELDTDFETEQNN